MAYDAADGYVVLIDGVGFPCSLVQTWTYAADNWNPLNLSVEPEGCLGSAMVFDSEDGYVLLWEGNGSYAAPTWTFSNGLWTNLVGIDTPPLREGAALADDPAANEVILFGGFRDYYPPRWYHDTWSFRAGVWTNLSSASNESPPSRMWAAMTYDSSGGFVVLFGGYQPASPEQMNDTWEYAAGQWSQIATDPSPPARYLAVLVNDPAEGGVLLLGGEGYEEYTPDDWIFADGAWSPLSSTYPAFELPTSAVLDPSSGGVLVALYPEEASRGEIQNWEFSATAWTNVTEAEVQAVESSMTYDGADGYVLLDDDSTWTYNAGVWNELPEQSNPGPVPMSYDASDGYVLAYGGPANTWEFVGGVWSQLTPSPTPPALEYADPQIAYDPLEGYVLLYVGPNVTWAYRGGVWTNLTSAVGTPDGTPVGPLVYDPTLGGVVMVGAWVIHAPESTFVNDTWLFSEGTWSDLDEAVPGMPFPNAGVEAVAYDPSTGGLLLFVSGTTWQFIDDLWSVVATRTILSPTSSGSMVGDPVSGAVLLVNATQWWTWGAVANSSHPVIESFVVAPNPSVANQTITLSVSALAGSPPLSYAYSGLPSGCGTADLPVLTCAPTAPGSYILQASVTDAHGNSTAQETDLVVVPSVEVSLAVSLPVVQVGHRVLIEASAARGMPPYSYAYAPLPSGCTSQDVPTLPCVPGDAGTIEITVTVTDAVGGVASATDALTVDGAGSGGSPEINSFGAEPAALVLGNETTITVSAAEGSAVLGYSYGGLPPGCSGGNVTAFTCRPSVAGAYVVTVGVTDPAGHSTQANLDLNVAPAGVGGGPYVTAFSASPDRIPLGNSTIFLVVPLPEANGSGAVTFSYDDLPRGCTSQNVTRLACTPKAGGTYTIRVMAQNAQGNRTTVGAELTVLSPGGPKPSTPLLALRGWPAAALLAVAAGGLIGATAVLQRRVRRQRQLEGSQWIEELVRGAGPPRPPPTE